MARPVPHSVPLRLLVAVMAALLATGWVTANARQALALGSGTASLTAPNVAYTQDFDGLNSTGTANTTLPTGWYLAETGSSSRNNDAYAASTGSDTAGDVFSFGAAASGERAFGTLFSGTLSPRIGAAFTNNTGATISELQVDYRAEQWRAGVTSRGAADRLDFALSTDATNLVDGTWTNYDSLDLLSPNTSAATNTLVGNNSPNFASVSFKITGLSIANGATFRIRWVDSDISPGADDGLGVDDFSIKSVVAADTAPSVAATSPVDGAENVANDANISVTFSEDVTVADPWFDLTCSSSGTHTATVSGSGDSRTLDPEGTFTDLETCTVTIDDAGVTDDDAVDPPNTMAADFSFSFQVGPECNDTYTPIHDIQGSGTAAATTGFRATEGIVVGDFEGPTSGGLQGFYLQEPAADGNPLTSEGIFVFTGNNNNGVQAGDYVRVSNAYARDRFNETALNGANNNDTAVASSRIFVCSSGNPLPAATPVEMPFASSTYLERFEGMLVTFPQELVISEYFNYDQFGEIVIALPLDGEDRPMTPTAVEEPGPDAQARALANSLRRITLDDGLGVSNPSSLRHPNGNPFSLANRFRGGDHVANATGVLGFAFSLYRIQPTGAADYTPVNPRPEAPEEVGGSVRVSAMNTLNFFITGDVDNPNGGPGDNVCGGNGNLECRGWDTSQTLEFERQRSKLLQALVGLNADVLGLNELENSHVNDPLGHPTLGIVAGLNELLGDGTYDFIDTGVIGTDAIRVGLIYKPGVVTPVGDFEILNSTVDPRFDDSRSRPALAQTFYVNETGARFTVVVNHLKSKGSACAGDPDAGDGQGNCNGTRTLAAEALVDWLATDPTNSGDPDFVIMGDLNSYAMEDPIDAIKAGSDGELGTDDDFTNLIDYYQGQYAYSYTFDGQAGYLDHALGNASFSAQVTGATDWHINSDEPDLVDYDTTFKPAAQEALWEENAYRTSDHDPVILGAELTNAAPTFEAIVAAGCTTNGGVYNVTIDDYDLLETELTLALTANSNTTLVPNANVSVTGSGANRVITVNAAANKSGTATLTFTLSDGWNEVLFVVTVKAGPGDDTLVGTEGEDILLGNAGEDTLTGLGGADILCGGKGEDVLSGGDGDDWLDAGIGDDVLTGGAGADRFIGGKGADVNTDFNAGEGDTSDGS